MKIMYLGLIAVVAGLIVLATQFNPDIVDDAKGDSQQARKMIGTILDSGAKAVFDQELAPPTTEYIYKETEQIIISSLSDLQLRELINQVPDGEYRNYILSLATDEQKALFERIQNQDTLDSQEQQILDAMNEQKAELGANQTETVIKEIKTSELTLVAQDRQTTKIKTCKIGNQCDITGTFIVVDSFNNEIIPGPYSVYLEIDCDALDFCNLITKGIQETTDDDGTWMYSWTINSNELPGDYRIYGKASKEVDGYTHWIDGSGIIEVVN